MNSKAARFEATPELHDAMVGRIHDAYLSASPDMRHDGDEWYPAMLAIMKSHASESGLTVNQCAAIYAANSINTPWSRNIALAASVIADHAAMRPQYSSMNTLGMVRSKVERIINGDDIDSTLSSDANNLKIKSFMRNLSGDYQAVTVDRWAMRIAYGLADGGYVPTGDEYRAIAEAYRAVAELVGSNPASVQAVTWCVIRGTAN